MTVFLADTPDCALLAQVIIEAKAKLEGQGRGYLGRTAIQKMMYFLGVSGVPMDYKFDIHHYGPFCDTILRDIEWLIADGVIVDNSRSPKYSNYEAASPALELIEKYSAEITPYKTIIHNIAQALAPLKPEKLELFATLDYCYRKVKAMTSSDPQKDDVIESFIKIKADKFPRVEVETTFDNFVSIGVFRAAC